MSPKPPPLYHLINLWISLTRDLHQYADAVDRERFGAHVGDLLLRASIYVSTIEGHLMTAAKLATFVGIPRPTVVRRLRALERRGVIEKRGHSWCTPAKILNRRQQQDFSAIVKRVQQAHLRLQKK